MINNYYPIIGTLLWVSKAGEKEGRKNIRFCLAVTNLKGRTNQTFLALGPEVDTVQSLQKGDLVKCNFSLTSRKYKEGEEEKYQEGKIAENVIKTTLEAVSGL